MIELKLKQRVTANLKCKGKNSFSFQKRFLEEIIDETPNPKKRRLEVTAGFNRRPPNLFCEKPEKEKSEEVRKTFFLYILCALWDKMGCELSPNAAKFWTRPGNCKNAKFFGSHCCKTKSSKISWAKHFLASDGNLFLSALFDLLWSSILDPKFHVKA